MKKVRTFIVLIMIITAMLTLSACGGSKKINMGNGTTGEVKTNGDVNVTGSNGESASIGENLKWPKEKMGNLPEIKGKITGVLNDEKTQTCSVVFTEMTLDDAKEYIETMKKLGYTNGTTISSSEALIMGGTSKDNSEAIFSYNTTSKEGSVSYKVKSDNSNNQSNTNIDMTENAQWPKDFIKGVPELKGKISSVINEGGNNAISIYVENVSKADFEAYITQLKKNGFTEEVEEAKTESYIEFNAYNSNKDVIHACLTIENGVNMAAIEMEKASK